MARYKMIIAYEGTAYAGWQVQSSALSIQGELERVLGLVLRSPIRVVGAGRTDAGVHAAGQVAHFDSATRVDARKLLYSLDSLLPPAIRVLSVEEVHPTFHAQRSALKKWYRYRIWTDATVSPFVRQIVAHIPGFLSLEMMDRAARLLEGTHDFTSFANIGTKLPSHVRTLYSVRQTAAPGGWYLDFEGDGFLYKMVRNLVGTLVEVGQGKRNPEEIPFLFDRKDRKSIGAAAPASGLCLMAVFYEAIQVDETLAHLRAHHIDL